MKNRQRKKFNRVNARKSWAKKFVGILLGVRYKPVHVDKYDWMRMKSMFYRGE